MLSRKLKVLLLEDNPGDARLVKEMLSETAGAFEVDSAVTLVAALDALAHGRYDAMLADLSVPDSQGLETFSALQLHAPGVPIVVLTGLASESLALQAVQSGAQDYLVKSQLNPSVLVRVLQYSVLRSSRTAGYAPPDPGRGQVIGLLSATGGAGATTTGCYFGMELFRQSAQRVLLMDLDTNSSGAAFPMRVNAERSIVDAASGLQRLDEACWKTLITARTGMDLLASPGAVRFGEQVDGERVRHVLRFARSLYRWILVDLGRLNPVAICLLAEIRDLILVTASDAAALHELKRINAKLLECGLRRDQIRLVLNRVPPEKAVMHQTQNALARIGYPVAATLPDCGRQLGEAIARGWPLSPIVGMQEPIAELATGFKDAAGKSANPQPQKLQPLYRAL